MKHRSRVVGSLAVWLALSGLAQAVAPEAPPAAIASTKAAHSLLLDIAAAGQRLVAVGERGHIVWSDDEGKSWQQAQVPTRTLLTAVQFADAKQGWAVGHDSTILHTADGGATWSLQHHAVFDQAAVDAELDAQLAAEDDAGLDEAALDEGEGKRMSSPAQRIGAPLMDVWISADGRRGLAVGAYGLLLSTDDGGKTWTDRSDALANGDGWHLNAVASVPSAPSSLLVVGEKGIAFRSGDSGQSFSRVQTPAESSLFGVVGAGDSAYAFGLQGRLYHVAGGWQGIGSGVTFGLNDAAVLADRSVVVVGNAGVVVTVTPAGKASVVRRADRQAILSVAPVRDGLVLVGEGGAKRARIDGSAP